MSDKDPVRPDEPKARHGYRNEVNWEGGSGRQPYRNQRTDVATTGATGEVEEGNREQQSGVTQDHLEQARGKP